MSILRRDKTTIHDLVGQLTGITEQIQELNTNGRLTESEKDLLGRISGTGTLNLDTVVDTESLASTIVDVTADNSVASVVAIRDYVLGALQMGGPQSIVETLPVTARKISLNHLPHSGIGGVMNFGRVRCVINDTVHHFKLTATADPYRFLIETGGLDINGYSVEVQYLYHYDARELNDVIGQLILDGLTLIEPSE